MIKMLDDKSNLSLPLLADKTSVFITVSYGFYQVLDVITEPKLNLLERQAGKLCF